MPMCRLSQIKYQFSWKLQVDFRNLVLTSAIVEHNIVEFWNEQESGTSQTSPKKFY